MMKQKASVDSPKALFNGSSGRWATEQLLRAAKEGKPFTTACLRTLDTLRHDEWKHFDDALISEGVIVLKGVADLIGAGYVLPVANSLGHTVFGWERITDMDAATVSLDGLTRSPNDRQEFELNQLPMPITHKDFDLNLRTLAASREKGEPLDTTQARTASRVVNEMAEQLLFQGYAGNFGGLPIYGYTTHPDRNTLDYGTGDEWSKAGKTGGNILADVLSMMRLAEADRFFGPYWLYVSRVAGTVLEDDFKANGSLTTRQRLEGIDGIKSVRVVDMLPGVAGGGSGAEHVILVQATQDVTAWVSGEPLQTIQWDLEGGFTIKFKAFQIGVPLIRSTSALRTSTLHRCGVVDMRHP